MTPRQWRTVKQVFNVAVGLEAPERDLYLKRACRQEEIRSEVESLLAQHNQAEDFPGIYSTIGGRTLLHYEIHERIGEGGVAIVYKGRDTILHRWVAIKVLQPWAMAQPASRQRLIAEARAASALNHPNIVTVHEVANDGDVWFIVMEYIRGKTLNRWIPRTGLSLRDTLTSATQIAEALAAAHAAGIVHGDLKPLNVMVTEAGQVKLLDFGLAAALGSPANVSTAIDQLGTTAFMAPEQLEGHPVNPDPRSDIFSFGVILYQLLTGKHPFGGGTRAELKDAIRHETPEPLPTPVPAALANVVQRCMNKNVEQRFQSMQDVQSRLADQGRTRRISATLPHGKSLPMTATRRRSEQASSVDQSNIHAIKAIIERITLQNVPRSRQALNELRRAIENGISCEMRDAIMPALKVFLETSADFNGNMISPSVRGLRKAALELVRSVTQGQLSLCFSDLDLADLDLFGMNFAGNKLSGFNFSRCFLVETNFEGSDLAQASLAGARVRNANFAAADLSNTDFTGADWFNALGLNGVQLESARRNTLLECPATIEMMVRYLSHAYVLPFESWSPEIQEQLNSAWFEYLRPGGLRQITAAWRS